MADEWSTLRLERDGHVGRLVLDRPAKLNAFSIEMWREMRELGRRLLDDPGDLRALVVIGEGRAFSSGIDTSVFSEQDSPFGQRDDRSAGDDTGEDSVVAAILATQDAYSWLEQASFATIAAVRGYALGAGLQCALACDLRVFARGTVVGLLEHRYGMLPDLGGTQRLPRLVGRGKAKELIWTQARVDAETAFELGICERLVDDDDLERESASLAATIAAQPPLAVRGAKRAVDVAGTLPVAEGLRVEAEQQATCLRSDDLREAIAAFVEEREPRYRGH
jgi:enoyl-CoA hydratase/carnithine racemase